MTGICKTEMEKLNAESFLWEYNVRFGESYNIVKEYDKPDFLIRSSKTNNTYGLEVTLAMFTGDNKLPQRKFFQREETIVPENALATMSPDEFKRRYMGTTMDTVKNNSSAIAPIISQSIATKLDKFEGYDTRFSIILIVGLGMPMFGLGSVQWDVITFAKPNPFKEIWVNSFACIRDGQNGIRQVS